MRLRRWHSATNTALPVTPVIARRQAKLPKAVIDIAWKAQLAGFLCSLSPGGQRAGGLHCNKVVVAVAREVGLLAWAIATG